MLLLIIQDWYFFGILTVPLSWYNQFGCGVSGLSTSTMPLLTWFYLNCSYASFLRKENREVC